MADHPALGSFAADLATRAQTARDELNTALDGVDTRLNDERKSLDARKEENLANRKQLLNELKKNLVDYQRAPAELESGQFLLQALLRWIQLFKLAMGDLQREEEAQRELLFIALTQYDQQVLFRISQDLERNKNRLQVILNQNFPNVSYDEPGNVYAALLEIAEQAGKAVRQTVENQFHITFVLNENCSKHRFEIIRIREQIQKTL
ncbi:MAG: hypothetical protein AABX70_00040, partial [Nanoarchaeota archaeon]